MKKVREKLNAKLRKSGGFTLVEMLIVVAIIAILIAVSIPMVSNALDRAKHATDAANERAAKAEIMICYLSDSGGLSITKGNTYYYNAVAGKLQAGTVSTGYGKHDTHDKQIIAVQINTSEEVDIQWVAAGGTAGATWNTGLCSNSEVTH